MKEWIKECKKLEEENERLKKTCEEISNNNFNEVSKLEDEIKRLEKDLAENQSDCAMCDIIKSNNELKEENHTLKVYLEGCANYLILEGCADYTIISDVEKILGYPLNKTPNNNNARKQLKRAKEIILHLLACGYFDFKCEKVPIEKYVKQAEQFIKENEEW